MSDARLRREARDTFRGADELGATARRLLRVGQGLEAARMCHAALRARFPDPSDPPARGEELLALHAEVVSSLDLAQRRAHVQWLLDAGWPLEAVRVSLPAEDAPAGERESLRELQAWAVAAAVRQLEVPRASGLAVATREKLLVLLDDGGLRLHDLVTGDGSEVFELGFSDLWEDLQVSPQGDLLLVSYTCEEVLEEIASLGDPAFEVMPGTEVHEARLYAWPGLQLRARWGGQATPDWARRRVHLRCEPWEDEPYEEWICLDTLEPLEEALLPS